MAERIRKPSLHCISTGLCIVLLNRRKTPYNSFEATRGLPFPFPRSFPFLHIRYKPSIARENSMYILNPKRSPITPPLKLESWNAHLRVGCAKSFMGGRDDSGCQRLLQASYCLNSMYPLCIRILGTLYIVPYITPFKEFRLWLK